MKLPRVRLTIHALMILIAIVALILPIWIVYDDSVRRFNEQYFPKKFPRNLPTVTHPARPSPGAFP